MEILDYLIIEERKEAAEFLREKIIQNELLKSLVTYGADRVLDSLITKGFNKDEALKMITQFRYTDIVNALLESGSSNVLEIATVILKRISYLLKENTLAKFLKDKVDVQASYAMYTEQSNSSNNSDHPDSGSSGITVENTRKRSFLSEEEEITVPRQSSNINSIKWQNTIQEMLSKRQVYLAMITKRLMSLK